MRVQAIVFSVFVHFAVIGGAAYYYFHRPSLGPNLAIPAPAGKVLVWEEAPGREITEVGVPVIYPARARQRGEEGEARFLLGIDADGSVSSATIEKSTGHHLLDEAARAALLGGRFPPAQADGVPALGFKRFRVAFHVAPRDQVRQDN